jgi:transmembrane sensor
MQVQKQIDELLALRASEWLEQLENATDAERAAFTEWLCESRLHVQAFLEVAEIEFRLHRLDPERRQNIEHLLSRVAPNVVMLGRPPPQRMAPRTSVRRRKILRVSGALAACAALATTALLLWSSREKEFETAIGEQRTIELADTSVVTLNAASHIEVHLQKTERDIELRQGEAIFTVAHDPTRPFKVRTRAGTVLAVGTQFNVYERPNGETRVSVLDGRVQLTAHSAGEAAPSEVLAAGEEADIRLDGTIHRNEKAVVANTVAWRQRRLVFDNTGLADMVAEFNRYNRVPRLRLEDVSSDVYRFSGIFDAADPESFVSLLEREPDLSVERRTDEVIVRPRSSTP